MIWLVVEPTPLKNYETQLGLLFPIYGKIKNVPNRPGNHTVDGQKNQTPQTSTK